MSASDWVAPGSGWYEWGNPPRKLSDEEALAMEQRERTRRASLYGTCYICRAALDTRQRDVVRFGEPSVILERYCSDCGVVQ